MTSEALELEGTWEEILKHSEELAGCRVRLTLLPQTKSMPEETNLRPENRGALEVLKELRENPLTEEEVKILEDFEQFKKDHLIGFRLLEDEP